MIVPTQGPDGTPLPLPPLFLTIIPGRTPETKQHRTLGTAKSAVVQSPKRASGYDHDRGTYVFETIDGIRTGRSRYVQAVCGGQAWQSIEGEWHLIFDIVPGSLEHTLPWRAQEFAFYELDEEAR